MSLLGFGSLPAASWRGQRGRQVPGEYTGAGSALQNLVNANQRAAAARFYSPARTLEVVDSARPPLGTPVSAMDTMHFAGLGAPSGLGLVNVAFCDEFEQAVEFLGEVLRRATTSSPAYDRAKRVYDAETDGFPYTKRTPVGLTNCQNQTARINDVAQALNAELPANLRVSAPPAVTEQANDARMAAGDKPPPEMDPTVKFAIVGGIVVAGIIGVAVITGQVAPLLRTVKKAF